MITIMVYFLLKRWLARYPQRPPKSIKALVFYHSRRFHPGMLVFGILISGVVIAQQQQLHYKVMRNGTETGWVQLSRNTSGNITLINMRSEINVRVIRLFKIISTEFAEFREGRLIHSYVFRKMNETVKANTHTRLNGNAYEIENAGGKKMLNITPVSSTVLSLYFGEPVNRQLVYSDSQQQLAKVEKTGPGIYNLLLPDGNRNEYYYTNGICARVRIVTTFYTAEFILTD
jgi:hypothetical protein